MNCRHGKLTSLMLVAGLLLALSGTARSAERADIVDTAIAAGSFKTLAKALTAAELVDDLTGPGPFTVFAPTDEAFAKLPEGTLENLLKPENKDQLVSILTYHVVPGSVKAKDVVPRKYARTLNGQRIDITVKDGGVLVDNAQVTQTDIGCSNGVIHVIDRVILPASKNIPATAIEAGNFTTLVKALQAAKLVEALSGEGPFTVFAPTDQAFGKLPKESLESLLRPENRDKLAGILKYHVVPGRIYSDQALKAGSARTLQGATVRIAADDSGARINDAKLTATDIETSNGVIHVIDTVLLPPKDKRTSAAELRTMIEGSVWRGARLYNRGHYRASVEEYERTARYMVDHAAGTLTHRAMSSLHGSLNHASRTHCMATRAWILRGGLDAAYESMSRSVER